MTGKAKRKATRKAAKRTARKAANEVPPAAWTVLVYMAGDNNLTEEMAWGLQELKKTAARLDGRKPRAPEDRINVVAHFDPRGSRSRRYDFLPAAPAGDAVDPRSDGNLHRFEGPIFTRQGGEKAPPNPLVSFVQEQVRELHRARHYLLVLSGHGSGAVGDFLVGSDRVTAFSIPELAVALKAALEEYGKDRKGNGRRARPRIDIIGMDSCLMSNAEVCFQIGDLADYLVGSEGWVANAGWPYHRVLEACRKNAGSPEPDLRAASVAKKIANGYSAFYKDYEIAGISTDIAVCRLAKFRDDDNASLVGRLRALSSALSGAFDELFVNELLLETEVARRAPAARALVGKLASDIADRLYDARDGRDRLRRLLATGSSEARARLCEALGSRSLSDRLRDDGWTASQQRALVELERCLDAAGGGARGMLAEQLCEPTRRRRGAEAAVPASVVLATARMLRELDPGVLEALGRIEAPSSASGNEATQARALLQKLHQVQWVLELAELAENLSRKPERIAAASQLLNAVVASRWAAQSFKGGVYVDLADFCRHLAQRLAGPEAAGPIRAAHDLCRGVDAATRGVILKDSLHTTGAASQHAQGLSVYFPCSAADYASEYDKLAFAEKTGWGRVVRAYLRATRRERRNESELWFTDEQVVRFGHSEVDPLEADGIEARIVGVVLPRTVGKTTEADAKAGGEEKVKAGGEEKVKAGGEEKVKAGGEEKVKAGGEEKVKAGGEEKVRAGGEEKVRASTEAKVRGEGVRFVWGNPPDGFFRPAENGKEPASRREAARAPSSSARA